MADVESRSATVAAAALEKVAAAPAAVLEKVTAAGKRVVGKPQSPRCKVGLAIAAFIFLLVAVIVGLGYGLLWPEVPRFRLDDVTVYSFNLSQPDNNLLNSKLMVTLSSQNPNDKIGIYYGKIAVKLYLGETRVTLPTLLPPTYQGNKEPSVWTVPLSGHDVAVGPALIKDMQSGMVMGSVKADGWIKWKFGSIFSFRFGFQVDCPVGINFAHRSTAGQGVMKHQLLQKCSVHH